MPVVTNRRRHHTLRMSPRYIEHLLAVARGRPETQADKEVLRAVVAKLQTYVRNLPPAVRMEAKEYLTKRGLQSWDNGELGG